MERTVGGITVRGVGVDPQTRCTHYRTEEDVVAIRFACCDTYFPCHACHDALADHPPERVPSDRFDHPAVLCGACGIELSVTAYLDCESTCPACETGFNPGCYDHCHRYFEVA